MKLIWLILWGSSSLLFLTMLSLFLFMDNGILQFGIGLFNSVLLFLAVILNFILRNSIRSVKTVGWIVSILIILLAVVQIINNSMILYLWNYSLIALTILAGTVLYRTLRGTLAGKIISISLTLFIIFTLIVGNTSSIFDRIATGLFILGALSSLYLIFKAELNE